MNSEFDEVTIKKVVLEKLRFGLKAYVSKSILDDLKVEIYYDAMLNAMVTKIRAYVWSREIFREVKDRQIYYPTTWWDAFKERWFPKFLRRKFPVKYTFRDVIIHHIHTCPHLNYKIDVPHLTFLSATNCLKKLDE